MEGKMAVNRFKGEYPKIGLRPTIDGRQGALRVRESLEQQTMNMAKAAKALLEKNLRYYNPRPVQVVIDNTTI
jgi:L-fucose isomerase